MATARADGWKSLREDGLHDPDNPALEIMQNPAEAFSVLPGDTAGNQVDWIGALQGKFIQPRDRLRSPTQIVVWDHDVMFTNTGDMPYVCFPHKEHTEWLDCTNCHERIFKSKAGATDVDMLSILEGEFCGRCHGAVSFPLTECNRCHRVNKQDIDDKSDTEKRTVCPREEPT